MPKSKAETTVKIRELNDAFRRSFLGGLVSITAGVRALPDTPRALLLQRVRTFDDFNVDNDIHGEHDFGVVEVDDARCFWKIDYYDCEMEMLSPDPSDPAMTARVLTVMLADEY